MTRPSDRPRRTARRLVACAGLAALAIGLAGCTVDPTSGAVNPNPSDEPFTGDMRIAMITHGDDGGFWSVVRKGAEDAAATLDEVTLDYQGSAGDAKLQSDMINAAINQGANALAVSAPDVGAISAALDRAEAAGLPIITLNSGAELLDQRSGVLTHVGQSEKDAGIAAGEQLAKLQANAVLCIIHEENNIGLQDRCDGAAEGLGSTGRLTKVQVSGKSDPSASAQEITAAVKSANADAVLALDPDIAMAAVGPVTGQGATMATFDLSPEVLDAVVDSRIAFTIDQQPYLQGYLPVVFLELAVRNRNEVGNGQLVATGPAVITKDNAAAIRALSEQGTR